MSPLPKTGQVWKHRNGNLYRVICRTNVDSTREKYPETVVYENIENGARYSRLLSDWHRSMTYSHFSPVKGGHVEAVAESLSDYLTQLGISPNERPEHGGDSTAETLARVAISSLERFAPATLSPHWRTVPAPRHNDGPEEHEG